MHQPANITDELPSTSETTSGAEVKKPETQTDKIYSRCQTTVLIEEDVKLTLTDTYQKQLQNLRKELNYISETDWMYEPLDRKLL